MIGAHVIDAMIAAGASADVIAAAWKADLAEQEARVEQRRARDADRQRRHRASRDVTVTDRDDALPPPPPDKSPPDPQKLTPTPVPAGRVIHGRASFAPPDGVSEEQWGAFLALRKAKRQPMTARGYSLLCGKLRTIAEHGFPPGESVDLAIERGWTTVHEPKEARNGQRSEPAESPLAKIRREYEEAEREAAEPDRRNGSALPPEQSSGNRISPGQAGIADDRSGGPAGPSA